MKEIIIKVAIDEVTDRLATLIKHRGFRVEEGEDYGTEQILITLGVLDNLKQQMLDKIKSISKTQRGKVNGK